MVCRKAFIGQFVILFTIFLFLGIDESRAAECSSKMTVGTKCDCPFDINALSFVGEKFSGTNFCIKASNDNEARSICTKQGYNYVNPGNPDYLPAARGAYGDRESNTINFYYCFKGSKKQDMCAAAAAKVKNKGLKYTWSSVGNAIHKDGICLCDKDGDGNLEDCTGPEAAVYTGNDVECDDVSGFTTNPSKDKNQARCICDTSKGYKDDGKNGCVKAVEVKAPPANVSPAMVACVKKYEDQAALCKSSALSAKKTCDQANKNNKEVEEASNIPKQVANQFIASKAGSGLLTECMKTGVAAGGAKYALSALKTTCDENYKTCEDSCGDDKVQNYKNECGKLITNLAASGVDSGDLSNPQTTQGIQNKDYQYFQSHLATIDASQKEGTPICKTDAANNKSILSSVLNDLGNTLLGAQKCACQAAATAYGTSASTCDSTPTAEQCAANPSLTGCQALTAFDICTQGSSIYSAQGCACQTNPKGQGCPGYVASAGVLSGFAGPNVGNTTTVGSFPLGTNNNGNDSDFKLDVSGSRPTNLASSDKTLGDSNQFNNGNGNPTGNLGPVPNSSESQTGPVGSDREGKIVDGTYNQSKSFPSSIGGPNSKKLSTLAPSKTNPNLDKYRPFGVRGVAGDFGGKSMEIWHMMHNVYDDSQKTFLSP